MRPFPGRAFPAVLAMRLSAGPQASEVILIFFPCDISIMKMRDHHQPILHRQGLGVFGAIWPGARPGAAKEKSPGVTRIVQYLKDPRQGNSAPEHLSLVKSAAQPARKLPALSLEVGHHPMSRPRAPIGFKDQSNSLLDLLVRVEPHVVGLIVDEAHRERADQLSPTGLAEDPPLQARPQEVQLRLAQGAFQTEQQPVIEIVAVIQPIFIQN